jgi:hypothetical protein
MQNIQNLCDNFDKFFIDYMQNKAAYNIQDISSDIYLRNYSLPVDTEYTIDTVNEILTTVVVKEFLDSKNTILNIIKLYTNIYNYAISKYIERYPEYVNKIYFSLKGGMSMLFTFSSLTYNMPKILVDEFTRNFITNNFTKSDINFGIIIDYEGIELGAKVSIFKDLYNISFIVLILSRNYINKYKYNFSDFEKNDIDLQKIILRRIRNHINTSLRHDTNDIYCKIGVDNIYEEAPCPNAVEFITDKLYDELYIHSNRENWNDVTVTRPKNMGIIKFYPQNKYIISANIIQFENINDELIKFGLTSMMVYFSLYKLQNNTDNNMPKCCHLKKGKGKIINTRIDHPANYIKSRVSQYEDYTIDTTTFKIPTLDYFKNEHYFMLSTQVNFPWNLPDYQNIINKYFTFLFLILIKNIDAHTTTSLISYFDSFLAYLVINNNASTILANPFMRTSFTEAIDNANINELVDLLNNIKTNVHSSYNYNHFLVFCECYILNIRNMINFLTKLNSHFTTQPTIHISNDNKLINSIELFGGYNMCNNENATDDILKELINILTKPDDLNDNMNTKFEMCYLRLIQIYLDNKPITQIFTDDNQNEIYNSDRDDNFMNSNRTRIILKDYIKSYVAFMFLNFLLNYHCFLILYKGLVYNTPDNIHNLAYKGLVWISGAQKTEIYKNEIGNMNPEKLLLYFCNELNERYYRFVNLLVINLHRTINHDLGIVLDINAINAQLFELNHSQINNNKLYDYYNYMYISWKIRLINYIRIKDTTNSVLYLLSIIDNCIINTIRHIIKQDGTNQINEIYNPNYNGLFDYFFIVSNKTKHNYENQKKMSSCCIVSTIMEMYLLVRIHEGPHVNYGLENMTGNPSHPFWIETQQLSGEHMGHWTCNWNNYKFQVGGNRSCHIFRKVQVYPVRKTLPFINSNDLDVIASKKKLLYCFLFTIIDVKIEYIRQYTSTYTIPGVNKSTELQTLSNTLHRTISRS